MKEVFGGIGYIVTYLMAVVWGNVLGAVVIAFFTPFSFFGVLKVLVIGSLVIALIAGIVGYLLSRKESPRP